MTAAHGTYAGWNAHKSAREPVCDPCRKAASEYMRWRRFVRGDQHDPTRCRACGSIFPDHNCPLPKTEEPA